MSSIVLNTFSRALGMRTDISVFLPSYPQQHAFGISHQQRYDPALRFPTVYLLHGFTGDHTDWTTMLSLERYACRYHMAVVMVNGLNSWYLDQPNGVAMEQYVAEELPCMLQAMLPLDPAHRFIAGLSMGGTGAIRIALRHPQSYQAIASMSALTDMRSFLERSEPSPYLEQIRTAVYAAYGGAENLDAPDLDIRKLYLTLKAEGVRIPPLLYHYGTEDSAFGWEYPAFVEFARQNDLPVTAETAPGAHDFEYWDPTIQQILTWFRSQLEASAAC